MFTRDFTRDTYLSDVLETASGPLSDPVGHRLIHVPVRRRVTVQLDGERVCVQLSAGHHAGLRQDGYERRAQ